MKNPPPPPEPSGDRRQTTPPVPPAPPVSGGAMPIVDRPPSSPDVHLDRTRRRSIPGWSLATISGLLGAAAAVTGLWALGVFEEEPTPPPAPAPVVQVVPSDGESRVGTIAASAIPSIVSIEVQGSLGDTFGSGSGVVYTDDGFILTNHHVIEGAESVNVILSDGRVFAATIVGSDPLTDIAVVSVMAEGLAPIPLGNLAEVAVGDLAVAVGHPLGLSGGPSVTSGIVSAFGRRLEVFGEDRLFGLIQTDAPITLGSSGGALLDEAARLIGITTAVGVSDVGAEGLGFAVPIDIAAGVAADLIAEGEVHHAYLGFEGTDYFSQTPDGAATPAGAQIRLLVTDASIQRAGASEGDVIVSLDGRPVATMDQLVALLRNYRAGDEVHVAIDRDGTALDLELTLDIRPENP